MINFICVRFKKIEFWFMYICCEVYCNYLSSGLRKYNGFFFLYAQGQRI